MPAIPLRICSICSRVPMMPMFSNRQSRKVTSSRMMTPCTHLPSGTSMNMASGCPAKLPVRNETLFCSASTAGPRTRARSNVRWEILPLASASSQSETMLVGRRLVTRHSLTSHDAWTQTRLDGYVQLVYTPAYGCTQTRLTGSGSVERIAADLHAIHAAVPEPRHLPRLPQGQVPSGRLRVPRLRSGDEVPSDQVTRRLLLPVLRPSGLSHGRDHLPQVHDELADVVLGDLPNVVYSLRDQREAVGARDWRELPDRAPDVQADSDVALPGWGLALGQGGSGRDSGRRSGPGVGYGEGPRSRSAEGRQSSDDLGSGRAWRSDPGEGRQVTRDARRGTVDLYARPTVEHDLHGRVEGLYTSDRQGLRGAPPDPAREPRVRGRGRSHEHHRRLLWLVQERHPGRVSRRERAVLAVLLGRVRVALQPPRRRYSDVLDDPRSGAEGRPRRSLASSEVAFSRSCRKSSSVWSGSSFRTTSSPGGVGASFDGCLRSAIQNLGFEPATAITLLSDVNCGERENRTHRRVASVSTDPKSGPVHHSGSALLAVVRVPRAGRDHLLARGLLPPGWTAGCGPLRRASFLGGWLGQGRWPLDKFLDSRFGQDVEAVLLLEDEAVHCKIQKPVANHLARRSRARQPIVLRERLHHVGHAPAPIWLFTHHVQNRLLEGWGATVPEHLGWRKQLDRGRRVIAAAADDVKPLPPPSQLALLLFKGHLKLPYFARKSLDLFQKHRAWDRGGCARHGCIYSTGQTRNRNRVCPNPHKPTCRDLTLAGWRTGTNGCPDHGNPCARRSTPVIRCGSWLPRTRWISPRRESAPCRHLVGGSLRSGASSRPRSTTPSPARRS